jgi:hypothetical protein
MAEAWPNGPLFAFGKLLPAHFPAGVCLIAKTVPSGMGFGVQGSGFGEFVIFWYEICQKVAVTVTVTASALSGQNANETKKFQKVTVTFYFVSF